MIEKREPTLRIEDVLNGDGKALPREVAARFVMQPLERGYGTTIGNALRRILLASMPGSCISSTRIEGVLHEFSAIEGVAEDVTEIILNLKKVVVRSLVDHPVTLTLSAKGPKKVTIADAAANSKVEIIDPSAHICEITKPGVKLDMEFTVEKGCGYRLAVKNTKGEYPLNTIFLDAHFSPITRVSYEVKDTRVGRELNYDQLELEVHTNGSLTPAEAVKLSSKMLTTHLHLLETLELETDYPEETYVMVKEIKKSENKNIDILIKDLEFSVRSRNCLEQENIVTLGELTDKSAAELLAIKNFGKKSLTEIREKLGQFNLSLRDEEGGATSA